MKKNSRYIFIVCTLITLALCEAASCPQPALADENAPILYLFWGDGCPHCEKEKEFLADLHEQYPELEMRWFEVWNHDEFAQLVDDIRKAYNIKITSVPMTFLGDWSTVGFRSADTTGVKIIEQIDVCLQKGCKDVLDVLGPRMLVEKIRSEAAQNSPDGWQLFPASSKKKSE